MTGDGAGGEFSVRSAVAFVGGASRAADPVRRKAVGAMSLSRAMAVVAVGFAALSTSSNPARGAGGSNRIALKTALEPTMSIANPANVAISRPNRRHVAR